MPCTVYCWALPAKRAWSRSRHASPVLPLAPPSSTSLPSPPCRLSPPPRPSKTSLPRLPRNWSLCTSTVMPSRVRSPVTMSEKTVPSALALTTPCGSVHCQRRTLRSNQLSLKARFSTPTRMSVPKELGSSEGNRSRTCMAAVSLLPFPSRSTVVADTSKRSNGALKRAVSERTLPQASTLPLAPPNSKSSPVPPSSSSPPAPPDKVSLPALPLSLSP